MDTSALEKRIKTNLIYLNESEKRKYLASEACALGRGGIRIVSEISGLHRNSITAGLKEINDPNFKENVKKQEGRIRAEGAGRKTIIEKYPDILEVLEKLVDPETYGNPENPLRWTTKSLRNLVEELNKKGYAINKDKVSELLRMLGYSLQQNQKMKQVGEEAPNRDEQFKHINETVKKYLGANEPVISIDCKKKELVGNFKNNGAEYMPQGKPLTTLDHDFPLPSQGKAAPYGVYDLTNNEGYVNVGISADTAEFAVNSIRNWWLYMGKERYPNATCLYINADGGGSNGSRCKLWKITIQTLANELNIPIEVSHFPPGTSKWNKIEHRMFSQISKNWRGRPLETLEIIINLIASTTTKSGLVIKCGLDKTEYKTGIKVTDEELAAVNIVPNDFCGNWNYIIYPNR